MECVLSAGSPLTAFQIGVAMEPPVLPGGKWQSPVAGDATGFAMLNTRKLWVLTWQQSYAAKDDWVHSIIKGYCLQAANKLQDEDDLSFVGPIIADTRQMLPLDRLTMFCFAHKKFNLAAHLLAKSAVCFSEGVDPPIFLYETARAEALLSNI
ncbi:hypothetical protein Salat_2889700 [Sesamum alatum]|uniref:Uncharacterized protein n=1 Tax=Sesamum alatum TaxID=300844 RepID=A0AAE2C806_9LAMI|nr:hypothetical protein Salat_2889700 [Sesamum alatum]